jgi:hypothetical protein
MAKVIAFIEGFDPGRSTCAEFATSGPFGGLIASGWHTAGIAMRLTVNHTCPVPGRQPGFPGVNELRWPPEAPRGICYGYGRRSWRRGGRGLSHTANWCVPGHVAQRARPGRPSGPLTGRPGLPGSVHGGRIVALTTRGRTTAHTVLGGQQIDAPPLHSRRVQRAYRLHLTAGVD